MGFFLALDKSKDLSNRERWQVADAIHALNRGETPAPFLSKQDRDKLSADLYQKLESKGTSDKEKWRICAHLEKLAAGGDPGPYVSEAVITTQLSALDAALKNERDPKELARLASQIEGVSNGVPFVSKAEHESKRADLVARLESSTSNKERWDLSEELAAL